jgi:hypothetical protein
MISKIFSMRVQTDPRSHYAPTFWSAHLRIEIACPRASPTRASYASRDISIEVAIVGETPFLQLAFVVALYRF